MAPKFRGLWHRRAKKIAKIGSLRDPTEPRIELSEALRPYLANQEGRQGRGQRLFEHRASDPLCLYLRLIEEPEHAPEETDPRLDRSGANHARGERRDHRPRFLLSPALAERLRDVGVDRETRGKEGASDHAPVWVELRDKPKRRTDIVRSESSRAAPAATTAASPEKASRPFAVTFPVSDNR